MFKKFLVLLTLSFFITACTDGVKTEPVDNRTKAQKHRDEKGSFFGLGNALGGKKTKLDGKMIKINAYLWRGALDTLSVNPLEKIETDAGLLQTEWVALNATEQTKISVVVLSADLQTSGIRVNVYKRIKQDGAWVNQQVDQSVVRKVENAILSRARELRLADK